MWQQSSLSFILASASASRARLLEQAGLAFSRVPSQTDERPAKEQGRQQGWTAARVAAGLALQKAQDVAARFPEALVLGADQMLESNGIWYDKAETLEEARTHLRQLRGQTITLPTAVVLVQGTHIHWQHTAMPALTMRTFSDAFLEAYLQKVGTRVLDAVGACAIEQEGIHLLETINGDQSTITGLPLLALLQALRELGVTGA